MDTIAAFKLAAWYASRKDDRREFRLAAIGIRNDGAIVHAVNGASPELSPSTHAEARLAKKLDSGSIVYVARVLRSGEFAMARPCPRCLAVLESMHVSCVYYTTNDGYGVIRKMK